MGREFFELFFKLRIYGVRYMKALLNHIAPHITPTDQEKGFYVFCWIVKKIKRKQFVELYGAKIEGNGRFVSLGIFFYILWYKEVPV
jgi:hypothetical protein